MTKLYKVDNTKLFPVESSSLSSEKQLEDWISADLSLIDGNLMLIGRQIKTDFGGIIDILAINSQGDLVIIELKKDRTPRDIVGQVLDYASWVSKLTSKEIYEITQEKVGRRLDQAFSEIFETHIPENLNGDHRIIIVASEFDASSKRIVEYLAEVHDIAINTAFFKVFVHKGEMLLATDWLLDQEQVIERSEGKRKAPWSGYWYANVCQSEHRAWEDMRSYNFLAAGGVSDKGRVYSKYLDQLSVGDRVFAYQAGKGYVGYGIVTEPKIRASQFSINGTKLSEMPLVQPNLMHDADDEEKAEYVVGIDWEKTFSLNDAKFFRGAFAKQPVVCKLRDSETLNFLIEVFQIK